MLLEVSFSINVPLHFEKVFEVFLKGSTSLRWFFSIYFCISECDWTLSTAMIFSQNIAVGSWVHLSAASVGCAYQLQMKIHSIIGQALARFWFLCQQQKPTQHWHEIIHQVLHKDSSLIWCSGLIGFSVMAWLMHQNFFVLLVCHQWWDMLWHLLEKKCC